MTQPAQLQISFADAFTKLHWGTARWSREQNEPRSEFTLDAVRNEVSGLQVYLNADEDFILTTNSDNWLHAMGFRPRVRLEVRFSGLPEDAVEVLPVGYVEGDDRRMWMETLDRAGTMEVPAGRPQAVYIRLRLPASITAGSYEGCVRAYTQQGFEDEMQVWEGQIHLRVAEVTLPDVKDFAFHLNLWQHLTSIARYYRVPLWSEEHLALIDRYYASLAQLGQKVVSIVASEMPWSGQRCYRDQAYPSYLFEHAMVHALRSADGKLRFDFSVLDEVLALAAKHHIDRQIDVFGLVNIWVDEEYGFGKVAPDAPDAVRVRCIDESTGVISYLRTADELRLFIRALQDHFTELGLLERVRVAADEPADLEAFNRSVAFVREAGPGFQYSAAINHFEFLDEAPPGVIDFIPVLPLAFQDPALTARLAQGLRAQGGKMHWYVCCWPPIPNTFLHSPLVEARLHGWLTYGLNLDGFLRWAFCLWTDDPWERVSWRAPDWSAGDMFFVLPGKDGAPVETLRYEALRMAVQDYELLKMVERCLPPDQVAQVIDQAMQYILRVPSLDAFVNVGEVKAIELYSLDPVDYTAARKLLVDALTSSCT